MSEATGAVATRPCPACGEGTEPGDEFCEACGVALTNGSGGTGAAVRAAGAPAPVSAAPAPSPSGGTHPCTACGAPPESIDTDGYCTECGLLRPGPRDHVEVDLGWAAGVTDRGRHHLRNEDAFHLELVGPSGAAGVVAVVCDGVSTSVQAEEAAGAAAQAAATMLMAAVVGSGSLADATVHAADAATDVVAALPWMPRGKMASPACTLVSAAVRSGQVAIGWVGDSRAYWIGAETGSVRQLTVDNSWAQAQIGSGRMTEAEADADPRSHAITRWIGADAPTVDAQVTTFGPTARGRLLLCSDGLWNYAPTVETMASLLADHRDAASPLHLARALTDFARGAGGHDNITVVVIDVGEPTPDHAAPSLETPGSDEADNIAEL